jgi:hypothetical protein
MKFKNLLNESLVIGVILIGLGVHVIHESLKLPHFGTASTSPALLPVLVSLLIIVLGIVFVFRSVFVLVQKAKSIIDYAPEELQMKSTAGTILAILTYILILPYLHFYFSSLLFLVVVMLIFRATSVLKIIAIAISSVTIVSALFKYVFYIRLP